MRFADAGIGDEKSAISHYKLALFKSPFADEAQAEQSLSELNK